MLQPNSIRHRQQGAVLVVGLIMLLLLTMIGLASIPGSDLQERMAGNMRDKNLAFQAAEGGLRIAENTLSTAEALPAFNGTVLGYWPDLTAPGAKTTNPTTWTATDWSTKSVQITAGKLPGVVEQPRYIVEQVLVNAAAANKGGGIDIESLEKMEAAEYYRVTARGLGGTADAEVILQTTFIR